MPRPAQVPSCEDTARGRRKSLGARPSLDEGKALNPNFELQRSLSESKLTLLDLLAEHQSKAAPRAPSQRAARPYEHTHYIARISAARGLTAGTPCLAAATATTASSFTAMNTILSLLTLLIFPSDSGSAGKGNPASTQAVRGLVAHEQAAYCERLCVQDTS